MIIVDPVAQRVRILASHMDERYEESGTSTLLNVGVGELSAAIRWPRLNGESLKGCCQGLGCGKGPVDNSSGSALKVSNSAVAVLPNRVNFPSLLEISPSPVCPL